MARNGFEIFDADTHVRPDADLLQPYLSTDARDREKGSGIFSLAIGT